MSQPRTTAPPASASAAAPPAVLRPGVPVGVVVAIACLAQFMVVLDSTIVTVALPAMRAGLRLSADTQQWVVNGYLIALGGLLMVAARAGDLFGRKRIFQVGLVVFTGAALVGGLADSATVLLAARIVQGAGAAALAPTSLSLITAGHPDPVRRGKALALWSMMGGAAGCVGVVLGGVLTAELNWRWVFFVNLPIGVALLAVSATALLSAPTGGRRTGIDLPGALAVTLGTGALSYGISQADAHGWGSVTVLAPLAAAAVLIAAFAAVELRSAQPLVPPLLVRQRNLVIGNAVMACLGVTMTGALYFLSLYLQQVLHYSALRTGLAMLPMTAVLVAGGLASRSLVPLVGPRRLLLGGSLTAAAGLAWLSRLPAHPAYAGHLLGATLVIGAGVSLMLLPTTALATAGVDPRDAGAASGLLNTARQIGGATGLAVLVTVASTAARGHSTLDGYRAALLANAAVILLAGLASLGLRARPRPGGDA
ncbi:MFS transporter [Streptacidiphilus sp. PB12-B1b]|uniref:MFS transporter n=1 Tax=Streptacidiphilus sp. PB12-B1b TaxID=2705012 RepID=UPI0015FDF1F3|nr:MFS transporter [Streptacidiphilus sp. PB12-B1b]QMU78801.1 MFS transporter [Streptacidiphilus sp. PB12-B1b]